MSDYETRIYNQPLELLIEIKSLMHTPEKVKYPPLTLMEVLDNFLMGKSEKEDLLDYLSHFKSERDMLSRLFGKCILDECCEQTLKYKSLVLAESKTNFKVDELNKFIAVLFLHNSNYE